MIKIAGFVDCVSLTCPSILTNTVLKLREVPPGSVIEVICGDREEAGRLIAEIPKLGHKVSGVDVDPLQNIRILVERIY